MSSQEDHPYANVLRGTRLFADLTPEHANELASVVESIDVDAGTTVVKEGDIGDDLYLIEQGQVEVRRRDTDARPQVLSRLYAGDHFGEIGLLGDGHRVADVVAITPLKLLKLSRDRYLRLLESDATITKQLEMTAASRSRAATKYAQDLTLHGPFDSILDRLIKREIEGIQADEIRGDRPTFAEILDFYKKTRFLYPEKLGVLESSFDVIGDTWERLISANGDIFKLIVLRRPVGSSLVAANSICAFEYAPGTWQGQHLVSAERHEYSGTLAALIGLVGWLHASDGVDFIRLTFRPHNPGVQMLFGGVAEVLPADTSHLALARHAVVPLPSGGSPVLERGPTVHRILDDAAGASALFSQFLHPVEVQSLRLDEPLLQGLDRRYGRHGLFRRRVLLVAMLDGAPVGLAVCNISSEGINFSFLENAVEHVVVSPALVGADRDSTIGALTAAVADVYRELGRSYVVLLLDERIDDVLRHLGAPEAATKEYGILTVSRARLSFLIANQFFTNYYRALLMSPASGSEG